MLLALPHLRAPYRSDLVIFQVGVDDLNPAVPASLGAPEPVADPAARIPQFKTPRASAAPALHGIRTYIDIHIDIGTGRAYQ